MSNFENRSPGEPRKRSQRNLNPEEPTIWTRMSLATDLWEWDEDSWQAFNKFVKNCTVSFHKQRQGWFADIISKVSENVWLAWNDPVSGFQHPGNSADLKDWVWKIARHKAVDVYRTQVRDSNLQRRLLGLQPSPATKSPGDQAKADPGTPAAEVSADPGHAVEVPHLEPSVDDIAINRIVFRDLVRVLNENLPEIRGGRIYQAVDMVLCYGYDMVPCEDDINNKMKPVLGRHYPNLEEVLREEPEVAAELIVDFCNDQGKHENYPAWFMFAMSESNESLTPATARQAIRRTRQTLKKWLAPFIDSLTRSKTN